MNKKLIAAAIAAAFAAPAAYADATLYGKMHASIDQIDYESSGEDNYEVNSRASRLGFKGSEDLGNGLKAIYQIELGIDINSSGADGQSNSGSVFGSSTRNTFVGLSGGFGTFLVGRHDTPAKVAFYAAGTDVLGDSIIDLNLGSNLSGTPSTNSPIGVFHEYRADDAIAYVSPSFGGLTFIGAVIPGEDNGGTSNARDGLADHYSAGLMYKGNGLKASVGYSKYDLVSEDYTVLQVGGSYTMNNFMIGAHYEDSENPGASLGDYSAWAVVGKASFGNNAVSVVYTDSTFEPDVGSDIDRGGWGLAAEHNFSKRTKVYAAYAAGDTETTGVPDVEDDVLSLGMIHSF